MHKCVGCRVGVYSQHRNCPLCGKSLGEPAQSDTSYPAYTTDAAGSAFTIKRLFLFVVIISCAVSIFINIFTLGGTATIWSGTASASLISLWLMIHIGCKKSLSLGKKILYDYGIVSVLLIVIDIFSGFHKWSTTYVVPFLTITITFAFTIMAICSRKNYREYLGFLIAIFFISLCPITIFLFSFSMQAWTSFVAVLYCLLTVVGLLIFSGRSFRQEIKKRFHF